MSRFLIVFLSVFAFVATAQAAEKKAPVKERLKYAAKNSTEAWLSFNYLVDYSGAANEEAAKRAIRAQVQHMYGPMGEAVGEAGMLAVPKNKYSVQVTRFGANGSLTRAYYSYRGVIAVQKGDDASYTIVLPRDPNAIYAAGKRRDGYNPCTDDHYQSQGDFWYFWNPENSGCPLKEGVHFDTLTPRQNQLTLERIPNTQKSYPEYARLVRETSFGKLIRMSVLFGMDDPSKDPNPWTSGDTSAPNYRSLIELLQKRGYKKTKTWGQADFDNFIGRGGYAVPMVEEMTKTTRAGITLQVLLFFGQSGINEDATAFHHFLKNSIENDSLYIYAGHSGLGGHLNLPAIERYNGFTITPPRDQYQIYFINGCTTYSYYNDMFFGRKATAADPLGHKNLEVITNGLATYFTVIDETDYYLFNAVTDWADGKGALSYQDLSSASDTDNLYGVNGDEDNPTSEDDKNVAPPRVR